MHPVRFLTAWILVVLWAGGSDASAQTYSAADAPHKTLVQAQGSSNTEDRLRRVIIDLKSGSPNMSQFEPMLRVAIQQQQARFTQALAMAGNITKITYVGPQKGGDVYQVTFEHAVSAWWIQIAPNGNIAGLFWQ